MKDEKDGAIFSEGEYVNRIPTTLNKVTTTNNLRNNSFNLVLIEGDKELFIVAKDKFGEETRFNPTEDFYKTYKILKNLG